MSLQLTEDWNNMSGFEQAFYLILLEIWNDVLDRGSDTITLTNDTYKDLIKSFRTINGSFLQREADFPKTNFKELCVITFSYFLGRASGANMIKDFNKSSLDEIQLIYDEMANKMMTGVHRITEAYIA